MLYKVAQGSFNQETLLFGETSEICCACMTLFVIAYSIIKEVDQWHKSDLGNFKLMGKYYTKYKIDKTC